MKKITAKFITENLERMAKGEHIYFRGAEYWMACEQCFDNGELRYDINNGIIYYISEERKILGSINGYEYAKVVDGVAYKVVD